MLIFSGMVTIKNKYMTSVSKDVETLELLCTVGRNVKCNADTMKIIMELSKKIKYRITIYPKNSLLSIYSKELKAESLRDI